MINKCINCGLEYEAERITSKYCSDNCRKLAFQKDAKVSVPEVSVPADKTGHKCKYCDHIITPEYYGKIWELVECCYCCVASRNGIDRAKYPRCTNDS